MMNSSMSHIPEETPMDVGFRRSFGPSIRFSRPQDMHRSPLQLYRKNSDPNIRMSVVDPSEDGATEPSGKDKYAKVRCLLACLLLLRCFVVPGRIVGAGHPMSVFCSTGLRFWAHRMGSDPALGSHSSTFSCLLEDSTCFRLSPDGKSRTQAKSPQTIYLAAFIINVWEFQNKVAID